MKGKKVLMSLLALGALVTLAACNVDSSSQNPSSSQTPSSNQPSSSPSSQAHVHSWETTWEKDEENHWHSCKDSTCEVLDSKAAHSWDAGTVTTPATEEAEGVKTYKCSVCEATKTEPIAKLEHVHTYSDTWTNDATHHWHAATCAHSTEISGKEEHKGGEATCKTLAKCSVCESSYGSLAASNHEGTAEWTRTETKHSKVYTCCGVVEVAEANHDFENGVCKDCGYGCEHTGGEATCKTLAVCTNCGHSYGELVATNHEGTAEWTKTADKHTKAYTCCDVIVVAEENHEWADGVCSECEYVCVHEGGEATCLDKAVCSHCGEEYGEKDDDNHEQDAVWTKTQTTHSKSYTCCNAVVVAEEAHEWADGVCSECEYACEHNYGDYTTTEPTFDADGSKVRTCSNCLHDDVTVLPKLVKVSEIEAEDLIIVEGQKVELKVEILTEGAENYKVEWASNNTNVKVVEEEGKYYVIGMALANEATEAKSTITVTVTNVLGETDYEAVTDTMEVTVSRPIVEYTFDNNDFENTGTNNDAVINHGAFITNKDTKETSFTERTTNITWVNDAISLNHNASSNANGRHLQVTNVDTGTGDFTISVNFNPRGSGHDQSETYILGLSAADIYDEKWGEVASKPGKDCLAPFFSIGLAKSSNGRQLRINLGKVTKWMPAGTTTNEQWSQIRVVKSGLSLTVTQYSLDSNNNYNNLLGTVTYTLTEEANVYIDSAFSIGFGANYGTGHPGSNTYYDDIRIYNFALTNEGIESTHSFGEYVANTQATCTENATEKAICSRCNAEDIREIAESSLGHSWDYETLTLQVPPQNAEGKLVMGCSRCEETKEIVLPEDGSYAIGFELSEDQSKLSVEFSIDPSYIDELVALNPTVKADELSAGLASYKEQCKPSLFGVDYLAVVNGKVEGLVMPGTLTGNNKAEFTVSLNKDDTIRFYNNGDLVVFGKTGVAPSKDVFTAPYTGEYKFYLSNDGGLYSTYPVNNQTYYLLPNANWKADNARFAVYAFGNGDIWVDMTDADADGVYEAVIDINNYSTIIFCRMNPSSTDNQWGSNGSHKWNQTKDLVASEATGNCYKVEEGTWDKGNGEWATYPFHTHNYIAIEEVPATCTNSGTAAHYGCDSCELKFNKVDEEYVLISDLSSLVIPMIDHTYNVPKYDETGHWNECSCGHKVTVNNHEFNEYYEVKEEKLYYVEECECGYKTESEVAPEEECLVDSKTDLLAVIQSGYNAKLTSDVEVETAIVVAKDVTVDLNGKTISLPTDTVGDGVFYVTSGATLTINGEGTVNGVGANDYNMAIWADGGHVVINGGTYTNVGATANVDPAHFDLIYVKNGGTVTINGGTFICETPKWTLNSHDTLKGTFVVKGGTFHGYNPADNTTENPVVNWVANGYYSIKEGEYYRVTNQIMLAEFTFENGLTNTGIDSSVRGTLVSNVTATRYQEVIDESQLISGKFDSTVLKTYHNGTGNSFAVKGLDTGTGDFSIVMKYAMSSTATNFYDKKDQFLVMGTNTETNTGQGPKKPCFAIRVGKDSSGAGYGRLTVVLNGEAVKKLASSSGDVQGGYFKSNTLIEISVVKKGTTVTVHVDCPPVAGETKCAPYTLTYTLASPEDLMITPDQVLGFGCNYGVGRPGNDSYIDDVRVYNYAIDLGA